MRLSLLKNIRKMVSLFVAPHYCLFVMVVTSQISMFFVLSPVQAEKKADYLAVPPYSSISVTPNVLFILDNSNSMDEDADGAAVGSDASNSKSEIARNATKIIIDDNKDTMRIGLMSYKQPEIVSQRIHNSFYYCDYSSSHYNPAGSPTPKDPSTNTKRFPNPTDSGRYIYYDTALPFYSSIDEGVGFCYSWNASRTYRCYGTKTGDLATPLGMSDGKLTADYGYGSYKSTYAFYPTDSDIAAGFTDFGVEMSWVYIGETWFANSSPGPGMLREPVEDSTTGHISDLNMLLATSQFATATDVPLRNAGLTPLAGTIASAKQYFSNTLPVDQAIPDISRATPVQYSCQQNYVVLVTDGLPSTKADGTTGNSDELLLELKGKISELRTTSVPTFTNPFDIKTYVIGFAIPPLLGSKLDDMAVAGGTDVNGHAYLANDAAELAAILKNIFLQIRNQTSSGTAASVISGSRSGEGAIYQSVFYPEYSDNSAADNKITWAGSVHASFVDDLGRMREDTNQNRILDENDKVFVFRKDGSGNLVIDKYGIVGTVAEVTNVTLPAATSLAGTYFLLNSVGEEFYVWFTVDGSGANPLLHGVTGIQVALLSTDTAHDVATKTAAAINAYSAFIVPVPAADTIIITNNAPGSVTNASAATSGATITITQEGVGETTHLDFTGNAEDIEYLWNSNTWLNSISDANIATQRTYATVAQQRHIFTFIDADQDKIADGGETLEFSSTGLPAVADLTNAAKIYPYIPVHSDSEALPTSPTLTVDLAGGNRDEFLQKQTQRVINYTRGLDQGAVALSTGTGGTIPAFRSRKLDLDKNGILETTWRLGDIVHSSPTVVNKPREALHLLYKDATYATFAAKYSNRRTVLYAGANDGMLHAFNGGFYEDRFDVYPAAIPDNVKDVEYLLQPKNNSGVVDASFSAHSLGAELWAYVPYNLLPHLYWPTEVDYAHVYYNDLKPRIFDAKIFTPDADHPGGWGTVLVGGMRFGGGKISVDLNRRDGAVNSDDRTMTSAYYILDITNPEAPPTVLGEISFPHLGYTTCYPTVAAIKDKVEVVGSPNRWFLIFGSGPAEADGTPGTTAGDSLSDVVSKQKAKLYVVDLEEMAKNKVLKTLDPTGSLTSVSPYYYQSFDGDNNAFISDPSTVDYDLDYKADAVYFGTQSFDAAAVGNEWGGKLRRIVINDNTNFSLWVGDSTLIDLEKSAADPIVGSYQPITAAPTVGLDPDGNNWVFFGTGRYFIRDDKNIVTPQTFYGIKEPRDLLTPFANTYAPVSLGTMYESTSIEVNTSTTSTKLVSGGTAPNTWTNEPWASFVTDTKNFAGWYYNFTTSLERNVGQAAFFGDLLTFTSYVPSNDICTYEGSSYLYALYYLTGTAPSNSVIYDATNPNPTNHIKKISLGDGLVSKPSIHVGRKDGLTIFVQTSEGAILILDEENPSQTKSGRTSWGYRE